MRHKSISGALGGLAIIVGTMAPGCNSENKKTDYVEGMKAAEIVTKLPKTIVEEVILDPETYNQPPQESLYDKMPVGDYEYGLKYDEYDDLIGAFKSRKGEKDIKVTIEEYENATGQKASQHLDF